MTQKNAVAKSWNLPVISGRRYSTGGGGALAFSDPGSQTPYVGTSTALNLSGYASGGTGSYKYVQAGGELPPDRSLNVGTGATTGTFSKAGSYSTTIRLVDTVQDALEADWIRRSTGTGVKWATDFRDNAAVTDYRINGALGAQVDGDGVSLVRRNALDGVKANGCLELYTPAGAENKMRWARPFCAFPGDVGYVSGAPIIPNWQTNQYQFRRGMYGHVDYWGQTGGGYAGTDGSNWQGTDFYIQFRVKTPAAAYSVSHPANYSGKMAYVEVCGGGNQELILTYGRKLGMYTNFGRPGGNPLHDPQGSTYQLTSYMQPNTPYADYYNNSFTNCWVYPDDEWVTVLLHLIPGHHNGTDTDFNPSATNLRKDTGIEVWVARYGDTSYTKVWEKFDYIWSFDATSPAYGNLYGFNCLLFSQYMNQVNAGTSWWRRYDEVIFSTQAIPCPQVYA